MKRRLFVAVLTWVLSGVALAEDPAILRIRAQYQEIQKALPTLKQISVAVGSGEGGDATAYLDEKGEVRYLKTTPRYFEMSKVFENYFYQDGALFFAHVVHHKYNAPMFITPERSPGLDEAEYFDPKKTQIIEERYYINRGKLIRLIRGQENVKPGTDEFLRAQEKILGASSEVLGLLGILRKHSPKP